MFLVVVGKADVLKFVVKPVAEVVGNQLGQGVGGVGAGKVKEAAHYAGGQQQRGQQEQTPVGQVGIGQYPPALLQHALNDNQAVDGLAKKPGHRQGEADGDKEGQVGQQHPPAIAESHSGYAKQNVHLRLLCRLLPDGGKVWGRCRL